MKLFLIIFAAVVLGILVAPAAPVIAALLLRVLIIAGLIAAGCWLWARFFNYQPQAAHKAADDTAAFTSRGWKS